MKYIDIYYIGRYMYVYVFSGFAKSDFLHRAYTNCNFRQILNCDFSISG